MEWDETSIALGIVRNGNHILLVRRATTDGLLGKWVFPGGKAESGETAEQTAVREVFEETGIKCKPVELIDSLEHPITGKKVFYILCDYISGVNRLSKQERNSLNEVAWVTSEHARILMQNKMCPAVSKRLDEAA